MKGATKSVAVAAVVLAGWGCGGTTNSGGSDPITEAPDGGGSQPPAVVSFARDVQPIFNARCTPCHPGQHSPNLEEGSAWSALVGVPSRCDASVNLVQPGDPAQSMLYRNISGTGCETMPPGGRPLTSSSASQARTIELWIQQGALNN